MLDINDERNILFTNISITFGILPWEVIMKIGRQPTQKDEKTVVLTKVAKRASPIKITMFVVKYDKIGSKTTKTVKASEFFLCTFH